MPSRFWNDVFRSGASLWLKMLGGAVVTGSAALIGLGKMTSEAGHEPHTPGFVAGVTGVAAVVGALLGAALCIKDVVQARLAAELPVAWTLRVLFAHGMVSLLCVWCPLVIVATMTIAVVILEAGR